MHAEVAQLFVQSNRQWRIPERTADDFAAYREGAASSTTVTETLCHAPYLVNVVSPDPAVRAKSRASLVANLRAATALGASALVLHPGSHRGVEPAAALRRIGSVVRHALDDAAAHPVMDGDGVCGLLFENTAGAGDTIGRDFAELAALLEETDDARVGICIDTQHLWASGVAYATYEQADDVVGALDAAFGLATVRALHVNDSKVPLGANRDRHENIGRGTIGPRPFRALLSHPDLQALPAVLEVPGLDGHGPGAADLAAARALHRSGLATRRRHRALSSGPRRPLPARHGPLPSPKA